MAALSVVVGGDATTRIVKTDSITGIKLENNTLSLFTTTTNPGDTFNRAAVLSEDAQMFVFDTRDNANTIEEVTSLSGLAGNTWSVTTVQTLCTDTQHRLCLCHHHRLIFSGSDDIANEDRAPPFGGARSSCCQITTGLPSK